MMIGVLALQGDYAKHIQILEMLKIQAIEIRYPDELKLIDGLVIPVSYTHLTLPTTPYV